jgi:hypothetical protein
MGFANRVGCAFQIVRLSMTAESDHRPFGQQIPAISYLAAPSGVSSRV